MANFIEKLREKPDHHKRIIVALSSFVITGAIFVVWLSVIFPTSVKEESIVASNNKSKGIGPLGAFRRDVAQAFSALKGQLGTIKESVKLSPSVYIAEPDIKPDIKPENSATKSSNSVVY